MQHLEKLVILTLLIVVLIYTILANRTIISKISVPAPKQETHLSGASSATNNDSFFPPPEPPIGSEEITEESFTESP